MTTKHVHPASAAASLLSTWLRSGSDRPLRSNRRWRKADPLPSWNDGATKAVDHQVRRPRHARRAGRTSCRPPSASPPSTTTARCGSSSRCTSSSPSRSTASRRWRRSIRRWKTKQPFKAVLDGDMKALAASGEKGLVELMAVTHAGMTTDEFAKIVTDWLATARASALQAALHRAGLPADAGGAGVSARQRLQDLHRLRRRHRVHAAVDREGLRHSARAGRRLIDQDEVRDARRQADAVPPAARSISSTTRPASRSASTSTSAAGRSRRSATRTAISKCCNGPRAAAVSALA